MPLTTDPLSHVKQGYGRFRRYAPRMLLALDIEAASLSTSLLQAAQIVSGEAVSAARLTIFFAKLRSGTGI